MHVTPLLLIVVALAVLLRLPEQVVAIVVGAVVVPHGDWAFDPELLKGHNEIAFARARRIHAATVEAMEVVGSMKPSIDYIFIVTP